MITLTILIIALILSVAGIVYYLIQLNSEIKKVSGKLSSLPDYSKPVSDLNTEVTKLKSDILSSYEALRTIEARLEELTLSNSAPEKTEERFIFFSDPHPFTSMDSVEWSKDTQLERMKEYMDSSGSKFILCGGDWLTDHNRETGIEDLKLAEKTMQEMFGDKYYPMVGNHDNNDKVEEISHQTIVDIMYNRWKKAYYSFMGDATRFYVFDSDSIPHITMDDYKREQAKWFLESLMTNDDKHIVIAIHMCQIMDDGGPISSEQAIQLSEIANVYNSRTSYDDYDFSGKTGKVHVILAGHWHSDNDYMLNNIPVYIIDDAQEGNFDMVLIDYDANELRALRIGTGNGRTIKLA